MRIALNARVLATDELRGWSRYTVNLLEGLLSAGHEVFLFSDQPINQKLIPAQAGFCQITVRSGRNYIDWEQRVLRGLCDEFQIDILHCPTNYGLPFFCRAKKVLTLHDAIEKSYYGKAEGRKSWNPTAFKIRLLHLLSQKAADQIITVSEHARQDIIKEYGVSPQKIEVIYEGADPAFCEKNVISFEEFSKHHPEIQAPYFFYVGGLEDRKNIPNLIRAWARASTCSFALVIGGGSLAQIESFRALAQSLGAQIRFTGYIPQADLPSFYAHAWSFIYPSLYEGFGLQLVESMQMGTPVISSNRTSLPEILGDEECTFDPENIADIAKAIEKMMNPAFREKKRAAVLLRRECFSWREAWKKTESVYQNLISF